MTAILTPPPPSKPPPLVNSRFAAWRPAPHPFPAPWVCCGPSYNSRGSGEGSCWEGLCRRDPGPWALCVTVVCSFFSFWYPFYPFVELECPLLV